VEHYIEFKTLNFEYVVPTAYLCPLVYKVIVLFYIFLENKVAVVEASLFVILQQKKKEKQISSLGHQDAQVCFCRTEKLELCSIL